MSRILFGFFDSSSTTRSIPTVLTKLSPPVMVRGMREFQGGSSFQFSGGSNSRKQYVSSAGNKHKPIKP